jgi:RNA polymerase sigma-70 factor
MDQDQDLCIERAQNGDREAFSALVRLHQARLRGLVALTVSDRDAALDIVQDAFVDAWRGLGTFDRARGFEPWLRTICRNRVARYFRERARERPALGIVDEALAASAAADSDHASLAEERMRALRSCIEALGEPRREILRLRFAEGEQVKRIAALAGKSANAISMLLLRMKSELSACADRRLQERRS